MIVRHKNPRLCPMGALSIFFFIRWSIFAEKPVDFSSTEWYTSQTLIAFVISLFSRSKRAIFRTTDSPYSNPGTSSSFVQRRRLLDETNTSIASKVLHFDRHVGALIGSLHGMTVPEIESFGLWNKNVCTNHYVKYPGIEATSKMAGFRCGLEYSIPRSRAKVSNFVAQNATEHPDASQFFSGFCPFLDDPKNLQFIEANISKTSTAVAAFDALVVLRDVFFKMCALSTPHIRAP